MFLLIGCSIIDNKCCKDEQTKKPTDGGKEDVHAYGIYGI